MNEKTPLVKNQIKLKTRSFLLSAITTLVLQRCLKTIFCYIKFEIARPVKNICLKLLL